MKNTLRIIAVTISILTTPYITFSQKLSDANKFKKALSLAGRHRKPLLLIINIKPPAGITYRTSANLALTNTEVYDKLKANFVVFESDQTDTATAKIISTYKITTFPNYVFMHPNRDVFYTHFGFLNNKENYFLMLDKAIGLSKEKSISQLQADYQEDPSNHTKLKQLIEAKMRIGITDLAELIEKYATNLRPDELKDYQTTLLILKAGPFADGRALQLVRTNKKLIDSIYRSEPAQVKSKFNTAIITNSITHAIKTQNFAQAAAAAMFARASWGKDMKNADRSFQSQIIAYYHGVKDTASYFRTATNYYDTYYMNIGVDSIRRDEAQRKRLAAERSNPIIVSNASTRSKQEIDSLKKANPHVVTRVETFITKVNTGGIDYANILNGAAWNFYQTGTTNINHLTKAMIWSRRAIELNPSPFYYDTLAHLLYRLNYFAEAEKTQETAINKARTEGKPHEKMQAELKKMKARAI